MATSISLFIYIMLELLVFIWAKIGLLISIISVNKDLAQHSLFWNLALPGRKSVAKKLV